MKEFIDKDFIIKVSLALFSIYAFFKKEIFSFFKSKKTHEDNQDNEIKIVNKELETLNTKIENLIKDIAILQQDKVSRVEFTKVMSKFEAKFDSKFLEISKGLSKIEGILEAKKGGIK